VYTVSASNKAGAAVFPLLIEVFFFFITLGLKLRDTKVYEP